MQGVSQTAIDAHTASTQALQFCERLSKSQSSNLQDYEKDKNQAEPFLNNVGIRTATMEKEFEKHRTEVGVAFENFTREI